MRTEEKPMIARDELAARFAVAAYGGHMARSQDSGNFPTDAEVAKFACEMADALLSALAVPPAAPAPSGTATGGGTPLTVLDAGGVHVPPAPSPTSYVPKVGDVVDIFPGSSRYTPWVVTDPDKCHNDTRFAALRDGRGGAKGTYYRDRLTFVRPATAAERAAAGLPVDEATPPPAPASVEPRRTVGAVVRTRTCAEFVVVAPGRTRRIDLTPIDDPARDTAPLYDTDEFVRWATFAECGQHSIPFVDRTGLASDGMTQEWARKADDVPPLRTVSPNVVDRTTPAAALTEEEREELADKIREDRWQMSWDDIGAAARAYWLDRADAAAAWFAKRGGAK